MEDLKTGATITGIDLSPLQLTQFEIYYRELQRWNQRVNLTRIIERAEIISKHFLDSLSCLIAVRELPHSVIDVGTGPGFPGLVLKIAQPHIHLTLVEATRKKANFLTHLVQQLALPDVTTLNNRAEVIGQHPDHRAGYQLAVARAVAPLPVLAEYMLPLLQVGGLMLVQKGSDPSTEIDAAANALTTLGGKHAQTVPVTIPHLEAQRHLVLIIKTGPTPRKYPRRPGIPAKRPIS